MSKKFIEIVPTETGYKLYLQNVHQEKRDSYVIETKNKQETQVLLTELKEVVLSIEKKLRADKLKTIMDDITKDE